MIGRISIVLLVLTTSIPEGTGGSDDGDPAPGRSPGPPLQGYKTSEEAIKISFGELKQKKSDESVWCKNYFAPTNSAHLNLTLHNPLFDVFNKLLPGLIYHVSVREIGNEGPAEEIYVRSTSDGLPIGTWINKTSRRRCFDEDWTLIDPRESIQWTYHKADAVNITFRFLSRMSSGLFQENLFSYSTSKDCTLKLRQTRGNFGSADLPTAHTCRIVFPRKASESASDHKEGLLVELTRLNVPCTGGGFIQFVEEEADSVDGELFDSPRKLCGKLEELNLVERKLYFPSLSEKRRTFLLVHKNPVFSLNYHLVDYCYNVTFVSPNGSLVLNPVKNLLCHFRVHLPYGNRVLLRLQMGEDRSISTTENYGENAQNLDILGKLKLGSSNYSIQNSLKRLGNSQNSFESNFEWTEKEGKCDGLYVIVWDGSLTWNHCSRHGDPKRDIQVSSRENVVTIKIVAATTTTTATATSESSGYPVVKFWYHAEPVTDIVGNCDFGEVLVKQFCVSAIQVQLDWDSAEEYCGKRGGHLASVRDETSQNIIDNLLINSPEYKEHNSYWIGASDKIYEGYFRWTDGYAFSYSNWFPGWSQQGFYNRQPNDDGFSHQDCVEIRRVFPRLSGSRIVDGTTSSYLWNDLDCAAKNFFLCERLESGESSEQSWNQECNRTISLTREHPKATVVSFGFPHQYPDNIRCETLVTAPPGFRLIIDFEELVIEQEPSCSYDYLELIEDSWNESFVARKLCDDMSDKLKLLRYISQGPRLKFLFVSDYSHHYSGFKARVSIESAGMECSDERYEMFNNSCYLFVSYPKVTWETANQICKGVKAELASILNSEEESLITGNIRNSMEYATSSAYWLGGYLDDSGRWKWTDGATLDFTAWPPREGGGAVGKEEENCLAVQWVSVKTEASLSSSGLYWTPKKCTEIGGYVCKKTNQALGETRNFNRTLNGTEGYFTSPGYPSHYYNNLDYYIHIVGPVWTRMVVEFSTIDLETQTECLYDFLEVKSGGFEEAQVRWCGNKTSKKSRSIFVSNNNEAVVKFHSDYSISGSGFHATWKAVDVSGCPSQKLTAREGIITSPNYGDFLLPRLDCTTIIIAPPGKRIWIEFEEIDLGNEKKSKETSLEISLGESHVPFRRLQLDENLGSKNFVSEGEKMVIRLKTSKDVNGNGFRAVYRTVSSVREEKILNLSAKSSGVLHHLNFPAEPPPNISFVQHLITTPGHVIHVDLHQVTLSETGKTCPGGNGIIEVTDNYADENGTWWFLCESKSDSSQPSSSSLSITSYLNTLHIRQSSSAIGAKLNATVKVKNDPNYKSKLLKVSDGGFVESCRPNPCQNGGKCLSSGTKKMCQCIGHFTGMFCALNQCELEPCLFGQCELTGSGYKCHCQSGYTGLTCERKQSPCEDNPCEGRGECMEKSDSFHCRCHAWWEGPRCERRMMHIPFKPLSERMLQEPFWLGLITVFVVLGVIGLVWCAKRHFPEKLEKLLAEEADRNHRTNVSGLIRPPSIREPVAASGTVLASNPTGTANCPRKLFGRLGIRKSSLLSLTSPQRPDRATSRTFSLDDLLRPTPRRTPSPRKKTNSSNPPKRNAAEKKQILQHLICPSIMPSSEKSSPVEAPILLAETKRKSLPTDKTEWQETSFSSPSVKPGAKTDFGKLEKKVTFAKLLSKVSAEMSSSSEPETSNLVTLQAFSTPVSPALERLPIERRYSHSICSNQGSDSLSSSEIAISGSAFNSLLDISNNAKKTVRGTGSKISKTSSSDFVLDMFRNFTSTSVTGRGREVTPSSTPSASSPQEELVISDESSMFDTPISTTSGPFDSPCDVLVPGTTIEIPVMDILTAQKVAHSHQPPSVLLEIPSAGNKFLSPIREMPTPMPSPALTPIMSRIDVSSVKRSTSDSSDDDDIKVKGCNDDVESENFSEALIQVHREDDEDLLSPTDEEFTQTNFLPARAEPICQAGTNERPAMIIPLLTVQEPSPPSTSPPGSYPGSPPPQKDLQPFIYSPVGSPRRLMKGPDKPNSLELPYPPPMITITCNVSEPESDTEFLSPASKGKNLGPHNPTVNSVGMTYLSPFSMCSRGDRTASESNLSSSGYSSMASPGPSRCGSNNPLCLSEVEDQQQSQGQSPTMFHSPQSRASRGNDQRSDEPNHRGRSDSETLSDDPLLESNDEGIGTDHVDEKTEDKEVKNLRDDEIFGKKEGNDQSDVNFGSLLIPNSQARAGLKKWDNLDCISNTGPVISKASLQLPTIIVQADHCDKLLSPVSSRSESPLSDKALSLGRFSPMFYNKGKCDNLPFTDSDGLYDFPSSDCPPSNNKCVQTGTSSHRKSTGRRRERRNSYRTTNAGSKTSSPTKGQNALLEVPPKDPPGHRTIAQRKPSPKRRVRTQQPLSSSSSTESLTSRKFVSLKVIGNDDLRMKSECAKTPQSNERNSSEEMTEESCRESEETRKEDRSNVKRAIGFRTIGHQIRFLRRIELSLRRKEKLISCVDSDGDDDDDDDNEDDIEDPSLSLLPQRENQKTNSIGLLPQNGVCPKRRIKKRNFSGSPLPKSSASKDGLSIIHGQTD